MGLSIRTLLIWCLMLAVPAQGAAAATMSFCGPSHHGSPAAVQPHTAAQPQRPAAIEAQPAQALSHAHTHATAHANTHTHEQPTVPSQAHTAAEGVATAEASPHGTPGAGHKCSACATCCSVAALLGPLPTVPAAEPSTTRFAAVVITVDTFAVDGPDRPPRRLRA